MIFNIIQIFSKYHTIIRLCADLTSIKPDELIISIRAFFDFIRDLTFSACTRLPPNVYKKKN
jgi:hypothetical protein